MRLVDIGLAALVADAPPVSPWVVGAATFSAVAALGAVTKAWGTPTPTKKALAELEATVRSLPAQDRVHAEPFMREMTPKGLFQCLHGMRRWYKGRTSMRKVLAHKKTLAKAMSTKAPVGAFRGFKVSKDDPMAKRKVGDVVTLGPSLREDGKERSHGHVSSWTWHRHVADRFSGASRGKVGIVVKLADKRAHMLVAPPKQSKPWFNRLYEKTMGKSFRAKEQECVVVAPKLKAEIVAIKRR